MELVRYGHWGRPLVVFPSEGGDRFEWEHHGAIDALRPLLDAGRLKVYCLDSADPWTWHDDSLPLEERARRHGEYERWVVDEVAPWIRSDTNGAEPILAGCSFGAYHAANFTLKRADLFPLAVCLSGVYDVSVLGWGERGDAVYFENPLDYVSHFGGEHLDWVRAHASLLLVVGRGQWEDTTGALGSTRRFAGLLAAKGIRHELDEWGEDAPHDWPSWHAQLLKHLPRLC